MNRIFLIGYMGSGKSSVGKRLAKNLKYDFVDLDRLIEANNQTTIAEVFAQKGEIAFRELERDALSLCFKMQNVVVALGGGTPGFFDNMSNIQKNGIAIYLKMPAGMLVQRLINSKQNRPLLDGKDEPELLEFVQQQLGEREKHYLRSHLIYSGANVDIQDLREKIERILDCDL